MAGTLISKIVNGEDNSTSFTNLQQSFLQMLRSYDAVLLGNYASGNTSAVNVLANSVLGVNYNLYRWVEAQTISARASDGSLSDLDAATNGDYYLVAIVGSDSTCAMYAMAGATSVEYNPAFGGWYVSGTQHRVIGGFSKVGTVYSRKWRYQVPNDSGNEAISFSLRLFADGIEGILNTNHGAISLYSNTTATDHTTTPVNFADFSASCPSRLVVPITAYAYGTNYNSLYSTSYTVELIALTQSGSELGVVASRDFVCGPSAATKNAVFSINPGRYKVRFSPKHFTSTYSGTGGTGANISLYVHTSSIQAYLTDIYGCPKGSY